MEKSEGKKRLVCPELPYLVCKDREHSMAPSSPGAEAERGWKGRPRSSPGTSADLRSHGGQGKQTAAAGKQRYVNSEVLEMGHPALGTRKA